MKTIVFTLPNLLAIEDARSIETAAIMLVAKNKEPSAPSWSLNRSWKYHTAQEL